jgi:ribosome assembly protein 1
VLISIYCRDPVLLEKITKSLSINIPPHILRARDPKALMSTVFSQWLPLSTALLVSVIEYIPAPSVSQRERMPHILDESPGADQIDPKIRKAITNFDKSKDAPVMAFVSKMVAIPESELPENRKKVAAISSDDAKEARERAKQRRLLAEKKEPADTDTVLSEAMKETSLTETNGTGAKPEEVEDTEHLIGFARLYSGSVSVGDELYVLPPKYSPADSNTSSKPQKITIKSLYLWMGRSIELLTTVPAGVVFGIGGLEGHILKSGTLCSQLEGGANLAGVSMASKPIVRVALEPVNPGDLQKMIHGMKLLEQSDPCAEYEVLESGEHVILTAGELHLERCLKDLRERFAKVEIQAGEAIVPFRETTINAAEMNPPKDKTLSRGTVIATTSSKYVSVQLRVRPLPAEITEYLGRHTESIRRITSEKKGEVQDDEDDGGREVGKQSKVLSNAEFTQGLRLLIDGLEADKEEWAAIVDKITAFGPRRDGPNILIDTTEHGICQQLYA